MLCIKKTGEIINEESFTGEALVAVILTKDDDNPISIKMLKDNIFPRLIGTSEEALQIFFPERDSTVSEDAETMTPWAKRKEERRAYRAQLEAWVYRAFQRDPAEQEELQTLPEMLKLLLDDDMWC